MLFPSAGTKRTCRQNEEYTHPKDEKSETKGEMIMKTAIATLVLALALATSAHAATSNNGNLPDWATKAFEKVE
jgi:hypothetical protein